jgi:hypothetical protein
MKTKTCYGKKQLVIFAGYFPLDIREVNRVCI